jgi:tetratricopeptide (TPR) repeat protein
MGMVKESEGRRQERQDLKFERAPGQDTSVRYGQRADEYQQQKEAGRAKVSGKVSRMHLVFGLLLVALGVPCILRASEPGIDPFYLSRLTAGKEAYRAGRFQDAVDEFRIGCFGLLERPPALAECTARLALAQKGAGRITGVDETLRRLGEIESRFGVWKQVDLEAPLRGDFEKLVGEKKGLDVLAMTLAMKPVPSPLATPVPIRANVPTAADVRALLQEKSYDKALTASLAILDREPSNREVRKLVLESAVLGKSFELGAKQVSELEPFGDGDETTMFYASVSLFETGSVEKARRLLEKSIPKVVSNPYVEYYKKRILG